jgi:two-component system, LytTR family, response regulator
MKYQCIIVDDEPLAVEVIRTYVENTGAFDIVAECNSANEAFSILSATRIDLMFLDIQMPGLKGIDFLKSLVHPPFVIMTTAYREYALDGFELGVIDYLLKPISMERFLKAIDKFTHRMRLETELPEKSADTTEEGFIYLSVNKKIHKILIGDILYAESAKDYLTLHTVNGKIVAKHTISSLEALLPPKEFMRIHRSFIVSVSKIKGFTAHHIDMGALELPIGPNYQEQVFEKLKYPLE